MFEINQSVYFKDDEERDEYIIVSLPTAEHPRSCLLSWDKEIGEDRWKQVDGWFATRRLKALTSNETEKRLDPNTTGQNQEFLPSETGWNNGESDSDWSDRVEDGEYDPVTDTVYPG